VFTRLDVLGIAVRITAGFAALIGAVALMVALSVGASTRADTHWDTPGGSGAATEVTEPGQPAPGQASTGPSASPTGSGDPDDTHW
jgi:hypothetical protein